MVGGDWVKPGATVIDVGINRTDDGLVRRRRLRRGGRGRRRDHAGARAASGPMTIACLLRNTLQAARMQAADA